MATCVVVEAFGEEFGSSFGLHLGMTNAGNVQSHMKNKDVEEGRVGCWLVFLHENRKSLFSVLLGSKVGNSINVTALVSPTSSFMAGQMVN